MNGYNVCWGEGHNFIFRRPCVLEKWPSSPTMQVDRFVPELNCWIIKCKTEAIEKPICTLQFSWAKCHYPIVPSTCAGALPGGANSLCSYASSQKGGVMSRFQEGLFLPAAGVAQDGWGYSDAWEHSTRKPNRGWAKTGVEHPCMDLDLFVLCWNWAASEVGQGQ